MPRTNVRWTTTTTLDPAASTLPSVRDDNHLPRFWKLHAAAISGFGVHSLGKNLDLYCREDVAKLFRFCNMKFYAMVDRDTFWGRPGR